jgi:hypothetical protein
MKLTHLNWRFPWLISRESLDQMTWLVSHFHKAVEFIWGCIQKFPDWVDNEVNNNNKHLSRSNRKGYGGKTHYTDSQNSNKTASSGRELYHLQFSFQAASPETFGYILVRDMAMKFPERFNCATWREPCDLIVVKTCLRVFELTPVTI